MIKQRYGCYLFYCFCKMDVRIVQKLMQEGPLKLLFSVCKMLQHASVHTNKWGVLFLSKACRILKVKWYLVIKACTHSCLDTCRKYHIPSFVSQRKKSQQLFYQKVTSPQLNKMWRQFSRKMKAWSTFTIRIIYKP